MKRLVFTAAAIVVLIVSLGGCKFFFGPGAGGEETGPWTFSVVGVQIYDGVAEGDDLVEALEANTTLAGSIQFMLSSPATWRAGAPPESTIGAGSITAGKLTLALPNNLDPSELGPISADLGEGVTVTPSERKVALVQRLTVYNSEGEELGWLVYRNNTKKVIFLYSEGPLSVAFSRAAFTGSWNFEAVGGWNCLMEDETGLTIGSPPADAKWLFYPVNNF